MDSSGYLRPCCKYKDPYVGYREHIPDRIPSIYEVDTLDGLNSHLSFSNLASQLDSGMKPDECSNCWTQEDHGLMSRRMFSNNLYGETDTSDGLIRDMEISLDFTCNMMCRICGPHSSSKWNSAKRVIDDLRKVGADHVHHQHVGYQDYQDRFRKVLDNTNLSKARLVRLQGGETFYSKNLGWFVDKLHREVEDRESFRLNIFTNGSVFPDQNLLDKMLDFKNLHITFSVDAVGELANLSRWGVAWDIVGENCMRWSELANDHPNLSLTTNTTISLMNVNKLSDVFDFFDGTNIAVEISYLYGPNHLSVYMVPREIRKRWMLDPTRERYSEWIEVHNSQLASDIVTENQFGIFLDSMSILDGHQGYSFELINPEMHALATELRQHD